MLRLFSRYFYRPAALVAAINATAARRRVRQNALSNDSRGPAAPSAGFGNDSGLRECADHRDTQVSSTTGGVKVGARRSFRGP
jgi:hypothetical protein